MRPEVQQFLSLGQLPSEQEATEEAIACHQQALFSVLPPLSLEEAEAVMVVFGPDSCFGLAWTLLHLIETAPGWLKYALRLPEGGEWADLLRHRAERYNTRCP